jgi:hypothetical protein
MTLRSDRSISTDHPAHLSGVGLPIALIVRKLAPVPPPAAA